MRSGRAFALVITMAVATISAGLSVLFIGRDDGDPAGATFEAEYGSASSAIGKRLGFVFADPPRTLPDLDFVGGDGRALSLGAFRGRFVLLNLWATWCLPCREEMPSLDRLESRLGGPSFMVLALSIDADGLPVVHRFYRELEISALGVFVDATGGAPNGLGVLGIPTTILIDRDGRELARKVGIAEWDAPEMVDFLRSLLSGQVTQVHQFIRTQEQ